MHSWKKVVTGSFAGALVALGVCACGSEPGNDALSRPPITVLPVIDAGDGCPGGFGCPCTTSADCTASPKLECSASGICLYPIEPCGNCNPHGTSAQ